MPIKQMTHVYENNSTNDDAPITQSESPSPLVYDPQNILVVDVSPEVLAEMCAVVEDTPLESAVQTIPPTTESPNIDDPVVQDIVPSVEPEKPPEVIIRPNQFGMTLFGKLVVIFYYIKHRDTIWCSIYFLCKVPFTQNNNKSWLWGSLMESTLSLPALYLLPSTLKTIK